MAGGPLTEFIHRLRRVAVLRGAGETTDTELLERFVTERDEAAFEALVQRHGPMVLGVCRNLLHNPHDAEDAFQATFLVLVRKAASIQRRALLTSWLYGVAYRIALRARANAARRRAHEERGVEMAAAKPGMEETWSDLKPVVHEELGRLPEKYRLPVVLCYLQGKTNEEAARQLAWPIGTVKGRLTRARDILRSRLARRGLALSTGVFATVLSQSTAPAAVPAGLMASTVKAAMVVAAGQAATVGVISAQVAALTKGALQAMFVTKLTIACTVLLGVSIVGTSAGLFTYYTWAAEPPEVRKVARADASAAAKDEPKKDKDKDSEDADRQRSVENLKQIILAMHSYADVNGHFPPAAVYDNDGKALLSWRVLLLPYLEQDELFKQFKLDEAWDSEHNKKLLAKIPKIYAPPRGKHKEHSTVYQVFVGKDTVFEKTQGARFPADIPDGTSNTIAIVEAAEAVPWTKPADLAYDPEKPLPKMGGMFKDIFHAAFCDGSVHTLKLKFDEQTMRLAINPSDGMPFDPSKIEADK